MGTVALAARRLRNYGWYICGTQPQADDHVASIGAMLESKAIAETYPDLSDRLMGKFGNSKGWRRNRLRCASGFTIDALGLDTAARGGRIEEFRPDFIVLDDIDDDKDSPKITRKKITTITKGLIPAGSEDVAVLAIQNLVHSNSVFRQLTTGTADFLRKRKIIGPIPALEGFVYEQNEDGTYTITSGTPTWEGFNLQRCENVLNDIGPKAFRAECLHDVEKVEGAFWTQEQIDSSRVAKHPDLVRVVVAVDPSGGDGDENDEQGIIVVGLGVDGHAYVLEDISCKLKPHGWGGRAVEAFVRHAADVIVGEKNFGGDMVESNVRTVATLRGKVINYKAVTASRGKEIRIEPVAALYGDPERPDEWHIGKVHHVGAFNRLEEEQRTWFRGCGWSPNRVDSLSFALTELMLAEPEPETDWLFF